MNELAIYFEIDGLAVDEDGNPCPASLKFALSGVDPDKVPPYEELTKNINIQEVLKICFLDKAVTPDRVRIISPEEYEEKYADNEDPDDGDAE